MRIFLCIFFSVTVVSLKAQMLSSLRDVNYIQNTSLSDSSNLKRKWFLSKYGSISASYAFFKGGGATILSAPVGLQLNRRLNNNLYAFAGISVAPAYVNFNRPFANPGFNKNYAGSNFSSSNNFGMYSRAEMGLMYINDKKTFSISGSFGVEKSSYPFYPSYGAQQAIRTGPAFKHYPGQ